MLGDLEALESGNHAGSWMVAILEGFAAGEEGAARMLLLLYCVWFLCSVGRRGVRVGRGVGSRESQLKSSFLSAAFVEPRSDPPSSFPPALCSKSIISGNFDVNCSF